MTTRQAKPAVKAPGAKAPEPNRAVDGRADLEAKARASEAEGRLQKAAGEFKEILRISRHQ